VHLPPEPCPEPNEAPPKPTDSARCTHATSGRRSYSDEQARIWARELVEAEEKWPYAPDGCVIVNAEIARWALRLDQEVRIREQSQLPVIPRGAQRRIETLSRLLLDVEGSLLAYWTDIPQAEIQRLSLTIRETLGDFQPRYADV
jgi:hypothetical protein